MNNLYVNTIKKYLYIYIVLIIEPYSCVTDDILCVWTFGLPGLYNVIKIIIIIGASPLRRVGWCISLVYICIHGQTIWSRVGPVNAQRANVRPAE